MKKISLIALIGVAVLLVVASTVVLAQGDDPPVERNLAQSGSSEPLPYPDPGDEIRVYPLGEPGLDANGEDIAARSHEFGSFAVMEPQAPPADRILSQPGDVVLDTAPFDLTDQGTQDWVGTPIKEDALPGD